MHMKLQQCCPLNFLCSIWLPSSQRASMLSGPIQIKVVSFHFWQAANICPASSARCPWPWCRGWSQVGLLRPDGPSMGLHLSSHTLSPSGDHRPWKWRILKKQLCVTITNMRVKKNMNTHYSCSSCRLTAQPWHQIYHPVEMFVLKSIRDVWKFSET